MSGEPTTAWARTTSCCGECSTTFDGHACPNCGEHADASATSVIGFLADGPDGARLSMVESHGAGWAVAGSRAVTDEQAAWLRRQGDVR